MWKFSSKASFGSSLRAGYRLRPVIGRESFLVVTLVLCVVVTIIKDHGSFIHDRQVFLESSAASRFWFWLCCFVTVAKFLENKSSSKDHAKWCPALRLFDKNDFFDVHFGSFP
jgi:hypothetical protein